MVQIDTEELQAVDNSQSKGTTAMYRGIITLLHSHNVDLPTLQLVQIPGKETGNEAREPGFFHFTPHPLFHILNCNVANGELATLEAMAAVHSVPASIGMGTTTVFIPLHRHSAGLTVFVRSFHAVDFYVLS